ncbi:hypothetical protein Cadr_000006173 [Camelus dromedarius]|uniref:Uncharacterized protein n=1 Tax=Camelus dromedarius TaxID=9838 RepID=A0A5N4E0S9_CAMDR|nr:hypothetical protein Cadr_000006173 [Camelus dromedarius]
MWSKPAARTLTTVLGGWMNTAYQSRARITHWGLIKTVDYWTPPEAFGSCRAGHGLFSPKEPSNVGSVHHPIHKAVSETSTRGERGWEQAGGSTHACSLGM